MPSRAVVVGAELDDRMERIFEASSELIFEATSELITNYATDGVSWHNSAVAVGKALVVSGIAAMAGAAGQMTEQQIALICDEANALIADRLEQLAVAAVA
jgi:hypothetical protein